MRMVPLQRYQVPQTSRQQEECAPPDRLAANVSGADFGVNGTRCGLADGLLDRVLSGGCEELGEFPEEFGRLLCIAGALSWNRRFCITLATAMPMTFLPR
jgi:hypothetical protein